MPKADRLAALRSASRVEAPDRVDDAAARLVGADPDRAALQYLPIARVKPNPDQPRQTFEEDALEELAASIREVGILQPILVRRAGAQYEIVAGERRWRAAQRAGLTQIPAVVQALDDAVALEASLTENLQREDLTPLEEARIFQRMTDELGYSVRRLAERLGKGKGFIESRLRLVRLPEDLQTLVAERPDAATHAREIEAVEDAPLRQDLIARAREGAALQEIRQRIQTAQKPGGSTPTLPDKASGRPDTRAATPAAEGEGAEAAHAIAEAARRLHRAIEEAPGGAMPPADAALRAALHRELSLAAMAVQDLLKRLEADDAP